jgi:hypothetical protein
VTALATYFSSSTNLTELTSPDELKNMFDSTSLKIKENYRAIIKVSVLPKHMRAILFEEEIKLDRKLTSMVENSFLTNALEEISEETSFIPKTSILSMQIYSQNKVNQYCRTIAATIKKLLDDYTREPISTN